MVAGCTGGDRSTHGGDLATAKKARFDGKNGLAGFWQ
jgi:hypothetical protein